MPAITTGELEDFPYKPCVFEWPGLLGGLDNETLIALCENVVTCGDGADSVEAVEPCMFTAAAWLGDPQTLGNIPTWRLVLHAAAEAAKAENNCGRCEQVVNMGVFPAEPIGECDTPLSFKAMWLCWAKGKGL